MSGGVLGGVELNEGRSEEGRAAGGAQGGMAGIGRLEAEGLAAVWTLDGQGHRERSLESPMDLTSSKLHWRRSIWPAGLSLKAPAGL